MILLTLVPTFMGAGLATQTAINSKLRERVLSPYLASAISFLIGSVFLMILTIIQGSNPIIPLHIFHKNPWWIWIGDLLGAMYVLGNTRLVPIIGTGQIVIMALFGQLLFSALIEQFALFGAFQKYISYFKIIGLAIIFIGVLLIRIF